MLNTFKHIIWGEMAACSSGLVSVWPGHCYNCF